MEVRCSRLSLDYAARNGSTAALRDVSLTLAGSEFVSLVGPSGCGKSTLLKLVARLLEPTAGALDVVLEPDPERLPCALVFQDHCVFPWMSVLDNVAFGLEFRRLSRRERHAQARAFIEQVGLAEFADAYPHELSVGMRQRVSLARAFVANPQILLMDEPFASLDALTKMILQEELLRLWQRQRSLVVYVTHDLAEAVLLSDRVLVMSGRPGTIRMDVPITLPRPRDLVDRGHEEVTAIERRLWAALEPEVRASLDPARSGR
ncbi:MAG: ABC transporter ATP-binding protein [Thermoanaerobaculia bacterium]|nr:ABC transporter ATP-binding protein [Thermoanaerobaculia bacterium]